MVFSAKTAKVIENSGPPMVLNATYLAAESRPRSVKDFFERSTALGSYALIETSIAPREVVQIVVDRMANWIGLEVDKYFGQQRAKLTVQEVREFVSAYSRSIRFKVDFRIFAGLAPHRTVGRSKFLNVFYFDDIRGDSSNKNLVLTILTQVLLERFTTRESRMVLIQQSKRDRISRSFAVMVLSKRDGTAEFIDATNRFPQLSQSRWQSLQYSLFDERLEEFVTYSILENDLRILQPNHKWTEREKRFSIFAGNGKEVPFTVCGRTPAEKRFNLENQIIDASDDNDLVPIEVGFHPFWRRLGHTTLRVGESLFELSSKGWRAHAGGANSARAYLFNNPYFKHQFGLYKHVGMPPVSLSVSLLVTKKQAVQLRSVMRSLSDMEGREREKFSLYWNNCNQGIMRLMEDAGLPGFCSKGYLGFSSILSFRKLLLYPDLPVNACYVYPLPGAVTSETNLRNWIPRLLYRHNTTWLEMTRAIPSLWVDGIAFGFRRVSDIIFKLAKVRLWRGTEPYFMN